MYDFKKLTSYLDTLERVGFPACEAEVRYKHKIVFSHVAGYSDTGKTKKATKNDLYWLFSTTKVITCIAAMRLVEEGKIGLDDTLDKYLPEFSNMTVKTSDGIVPAKNKIKIRNLFAMTAGFNYILDTPELVKVRADKNATTREIVAALSRQPLDFEPDTHYSYSLCHDVLAAVIEVASGMTFGEYLNKILFSPLEIKNMGFHMSEADKVRLSQQYLYERWNNSSHPIENNNDYILSDVYESGGAGLYSTVGDYSKIIDAVANGGVAENGYRLLKPETIKLMQVNELNDSEMKDFVHEPRRYGYGWGLCGRVHINKDVSLSLTPVGEFGWDGAAASYALIDPENNVSIFFGTFVRASDYAYEKVHTHLRDLTYEILGLN